MVSRPRLVETHRRDMDANLARQIDERRHQQRQSEDEHHRHETAAGEPDEGGQSGEALAASLATGHQTDSASRVI